MMEKLIQLTKYHVKNINIIIIKNLGLLIPSLQDKKILFYFFSHDYMNQIILNISYSIEDRDMDFLSYYINFLKTIANKLDTSTLSLFFHKENNNFPLLDEASGFFKYQDVMIKNTARNIFLSLIKIKYEPMIQYICDIPRITDLLLLADNIKSYIIYMTNTNIKNNKNIKEVEIRLKEVEESLIDDILFMQDILSVGIQKINYILINCLFSIPLQYLFNCILTHHKVNIAFYILNLILKNIKNECINNLISFVLYSSQIHIKINENIANEESQEIYNLLYLNKFISHNSGFSNLIFEEYIILIYSQNFLKSIRHIKEEDKIFQEMKNISNYIKGSSNDAKNDVNIGVKIISEILRQNNKLTKVIKKMEAYHNFISKYTGINIGISHNEANFSFLKVIYDNLLIYSNNNLKNNMFIQENIIKKACFDFIDYKNPLENQCTYINQIFLIIHIMNSNKISIELKKFLCLNKNIYEGNELKKSNNSDEGIHNSDEPQDNLRHSKNSLNEIILNNDYNIVNDNNIINNAKENLRYNDDNNKSTINNKNRDNLFKDFFGISEKNLDCIKINNDQGLTEDNNSNSNILLLQKPINSENNDIPGFDSSKNFILNKIKMNFDDFNFNINYLNRLFFIYNSKDCDQDNLNLKEHDFLLQKIVNIIFNNDKLLSMINCRLSLELIENLILGSSNHIFYEDKYNHIFSKKYIKILNDINTILLKSNSSKTKVYKFAYQYFEDSFILNKKKSQILLNDCFEKESSYLLLNIKNKDENDIKTFNYFDFPTKEHEILQCLFQLLIGLYDLKNLFGFDKKYNYTNDKDIQNAQKFLLRNIDFPLKLIDSNQDVGKIINQKELKVEPIPIVYKSKDEECLNYFIFYYHNYLFIVTPSSPLSTKKEDNGEINQNFIIKFRIPLRQIITYADRGEPRMLHLTNEENNIETTIYFEGVSTASKMKESISNAIKLANLKEFSELKRFINNLMEK